MVGNRSNFNDFDVIRCFLAIGAKKSRGALAGELELGEGTVRGILGILKDKRLISSTRLGHSLTEKGEGIFSEIRKAMPYFNKANTSYYPGKQAAAVARAKKPVKIGFKERDIAVRNGADAALVLVYGNRLSAPGLSRKFPGLEKIFRFEKGDILVVAFAKDYRGAANSALSVCSSIVSISL